MTTTEHRYGGRGAAEALFAARGGEVLLSGPAGTGKSRACLEKLLGLALKYPGMKGLICRKTAISLTSSAIQTWEEAVIPEFLAAGYVRFKGATEREPARYSFRNGSTVSLVGMDKATKIMSTEFDLIYVQEAIELTLTDWESLTSRLRNGVMPYQQLIADTNPSTPTHWLKQRAASGTLTLLESRHTDNPLYYDDNGTPTEVGAAYLALLDNLTGVRKYRLRDGLWVAAEGVVYEEFDPALNMVDRFDIPQDWPRYWSIDFGFTNPFVCQRWAADPDGRLFLYAETYRTGRTVDQHARDILGEVCDEAGVWREPRPQRIICDHDIAERTTLARELGLPNEAAYKNVTDGIQAVQRRVRPAADGRPRLFLVRDAVSHRDQSLVDAMKPASTVEELPGYVWKDNGKEEPVKEDDHGLDALRYVVAALDLRGRPQIWVIG